MQDERWQEIKTIWKQNQWLYILAGFIAGLLVEPLLQLVAADVSSFLQTLVPEAIGIVFTVLFIDRLYRQREEQREERELKARLIRELGSSVNEVARRAAEELEAQGWLQDGSLFKAKLGAANLYRTFLWYANLRQAFLAYAHLQEAMLSHANLQSADLRSANLQDADLSYANIKGANLSNSNLQTADIDDMEYGENVVLPDGTHWTPDTDMRRFTDPTHPDFWRSDDPASPAYRGKEE